MGRKDKSGTVALVYEVARGDKSGQSVTTLKPGERTSPEVTVCRRDSFEYACIETALSGGGVAAE